jgi:hypothetical protein
MDNKYLWIGILILAIVLGCVVYFTKQQKNRNAIIEENLASTKAIIYQEAKAMKGKKIIRYKFITDNQEFKGHLMVSTHANLKTGDSIEVEFSATNPSINRMKK